MKGLTLSFVYVDLHLIDSIEIALLGGSSTTWADDGCYVVLVKKGLL